MSPGYFLNSSDNNVNCITSSRVDHAVGLMNFIIIRMFLFFQITLYFAYFSLLQNEKKLVGSTSCMLPPILLLVLRSSNSVHDLELTSTSSHQASRDDGAGRRLVLASSVKIHREKESKHCKIYPPLPFLHHSILLGLSRNSSAPYQFLSLSLKIKTRPRSLYGQFKIFLFSVGFLLFLFSTVSRSLIVRSSRSRPKDLHTHIRASPVT